MVEFNPWVRTHARFALSTIEFLTDKLGFLVAFVFQQYIRTGPVMFKWLDDLEYLKGGNPDAPEGIEFRIIESEAQRRAEGFGNVREKLRMYREARDGPKSTEKTSAKTNRDTSGRCLVS